MDAVIQLALHGHISLGLLVVVAPLGLGACELAELLVNLDCVAEPLDLVDSITVTSGCLLALHSLGIEGLVGWVVPSSSAWLLVQGLVEIEGLLNVLRCARLLAAHVARVRLLDLVHLVSSHLHHLLLEQVWHLEGVVLVLLQSWNYRVRDLGESLPLRTALHDLKLGMVLANGRLWVVLRAQQLLSQPSRHLVCKAELLVGFSDVAILGTQDLRPLRLSSLRWLVLLVLLARLAEHGLVQQLLAGIMLIVPSVEEPMQVRRVASCRHFVLDLQVVLVLDLLDLRLLEVPQQPLHSRVAHAARL